MGLESSVFHAFSTLGMRTASASFRKLREGDVDAARREIAGEIARHQKNLKQDIETQKKRPLAKMRRPEKLEKDMLERIQRWNAKAAVAAKETSDKREQLAAAIKYRENRQRTRRAAMEARVAAAIDEERHPKGKHS